MNRRSPVAATVVWLAVAMAACTDAAAPIPSPDDSVEPATVSDSAYLRKALAAARWIRSKSISQPEGMIWPADPLDTATVHTSLYTGTPGVVLFLLETWRVTGDPSYLHEARAGADLLAARLQPATDGDGWGLYTGIAGVAFTLEETHRATGDERYRRAALRAVDMIHGAARSAGEGVEWSPSTDIISGTAGIGVFLLYAAENMAHTPSLELAARAGRRLVELGESVDGGRMWRMRPDFEPNMPNFSHGTAGVAYFLAALYEATGEPAFLRAATDGARYLQAIAVTEGDVCLVFHDEPEGTDLFYLSWCHGPAGTARTFYKLWQATGDDLWMEWVKRSANAILQSGIPEQRTPGFWNNVGQCCGNAGVAEFFLALYRHGGEQLYLDFAHRVADEMIARGRDESGGLMWVQAEHRQRPDFLVAQTGYMQGAAGIGALLLHIDAAEDPDYSPLLLPDSPFGEAWARLQ